MRFLIEITMFMDAQKLFADGIREMSQRLFVCAVAILMSHFPFS